MYIFLRLRIATGLNKYFELFANYIFKCYLSFNSGINSGVFSDVVDVNWEKSDNGRDYQNSITVPRLVLII